MVILENIDIDMDFLENIDIDIDINKGILQNIDIDEISNWLEFGRDPPPPPWGSLGHFIHNFF